VLFIGALTKGGLNVILKYYLSGVLGVALILALISPVSGLIKVDWTVEKLYKETTKAAIVGKVDSVDAETRVINVSLTQALKGKSPGPKIRVQVVSPPEFLKEVAANQPLVFFLSETEGGGKAVIHVADTWLLAQGVPNGNLLVWRVIQVWDAVKQSFPGRTAALVQYVTDLAAGKESFANKWEHKPFAGGMKKRASLPVKNAAWILAEDLNGDKKPDLIVNSAAGTQVFFAKDAAYEDATAAAGAFEKSGGYHAVGDVNGDGKADLLLDGVLWTNAGGKFTAAKSPLELPKGAPLAAAILDANGDQKNDVMFVSASGELRVYENGGGDKWTAKPAQNLWTAGDAPLFAAFGDFGDTGKPHLLVITKSGISRYALDADGGPPADFTRLTGLDLKKMDKYKDGFKNLQVVAVNMEKDGDPKTDIFALSDAGPVLFLNRGLGAFFVDENVPTMATPVAKPSASPLWTRADLHGKGVDDILLLSEDGTLFEIDNTP
jgi:hypothetical protein